MNNHRIDKSKLVKTLKDLVRIDSVNPSLVKGGAGEAEIAEYLENWMDSVGLVTTKVDVESGRPNVVGFLSGEGGGKTLMLNGHMDTVGVEYMTIDPFDPIVKDGMLYGRGSADMKGGLAASMLAIKSVVDSGTRLKGDVILAAVCDEEYASIGTEKLMQDTTADAAIVGEPTSCQIQIAHKGFAWVNVETRGTAAHGSAYKVGVDAITKMGHVLLEIEQLGKRLEKTKHELVGPGSVHASIIEGGRELSTYPDKCKLQLERRLIPGETREDVENEMNEILQRIEEKDPKFNAIYETTFYRGPMELNKEQPICQTLLKISEKTTGKAPRFVGGSGWMDTEIIWRKGIPAVAFGPHGNGIHSREEYVDLDTVIVTAEIQNQVIKEYCGVVLSQ
jgi:acetylornithine deacetylase